MENGKMTLSIGDKLKLHPKTGKAKSVINRDGSLFEVLNFEDTVLFDEGKDWIDLQSIDNPKNGRWIQRFHDKNFDWEIIR
tara:strand:- start:466 stop:708 length:243 start_codon:yes stop_codon:yes gene_type:complete